MGETSPVSENKRTMGWVGRVLTIAGALVAPVGVVVAIFAVLVPAIDSVRADQTAALNVFRAEVRDDLAKVRADIASLRESVARIEGALSARPAPAVPAGLDRTDGPFALPAAFRWDSYYAGPG